MDARFSGEKDVSMKIEAPKKFKSAYSFFVSHTSTEFQKPLQKVRLIELRNDSYPFELLP